jgi:hypothetical protein
MQGSLEISVFEFSWDERNERHCARHQVTPVLVEEIKDGAPKFFENDPGKAGTHMMIGPDGSGRFWTIVIKPSGETGVWRPITGWPSDSAEIRKYNG